MKLKKEMEKVIKHINLCHNLINMLKMILKDPLLNEEVITMLKEEFEMFENSKKEIC